MTFSPPLNFATILALSLIPAAIAVYMRYRGNLKKSRRGDYTLLTRLVVLALLLLIYLNPQKIQFEESKMKKNKHVLLLDRSASMDQGGQKTRFNKALEIIRKIEADKEAQEFVELVYFDEVLKTGKNLKAEGMQSRLGKALQEVIGSRKELASIIVFSDGNIREQAEVGAALRLAAQKKVDISVVPMTDEAKNFNLRISNCMVDQVAPANSEIPLDVLLECGDYQQGSSNLIVRNSKGKEIGRRKISLNGGTIRQRFVLKTGNSSESYKVSLEAKAGERNLQDNEFSFKVKVNDSRIKVLYMEGTPHTIEFEGKRVPHISFMPRAWDEAGNITCDTLTCDVQLNSGGRLYNIKDRNRAFPLTREELYEYDVVICSDINRSLFSDEQLKWVHDLVVERGGGFMMGGGATSFGDGGWDKTIWEKIIPVDMNAPDLSNKKVSFKHAFNRLAYSHPVLKLVNDPSKNAKILGESILMRGSNVVKRLKPGATALAYHGLKKSMPTIAVQSYGLGRSMAFTSDPAGGWGIYMQTTWGPGGTNNLYYNKFMVNTIRWLAENSLARQQSSLLVHSHGLNFNSGDEVEVFARVKSSGENPVSRITVSLPGRVGKEMLANVDKSQFQFKLKLSEKTSGSQTVTFKSFNAQGKLLETAERHIRVRNERRELLDVSVDGAYLESIALAAHGSVYQDSQEITEMIAKRRETAGQVKKSYTLPLWDTPLLLMLILLLLGSEWAIRKHGELKG